jgi:hypothetical protein
MNDDDFDVQDLDEFQQELGLTEEVEPYYL